MMHFPSRNQFRSDRNLTFSIDSGILDYDIAWWYQGLIRSSINFNSETRLSFDGEFRLPDRSSREGNERDIVGFWPFMNFLVKGSVGIWFWFANWMNNRYGEGCWYFHGKWKFEVAIGWQNLTIAVRGVLGIWKSLLFFKLRNVLSCKWSEIEIFLKKIIILRVKVFDYILSDLGIPRIRDL